MRVLWMNLPDPKNCIAPKPLGVGRNITHGIPQKL